MLKYIFSIALGFLFMQSPAKAVDTAFSTTTCGTQNYQNNTVNAIVQTLTGYLCVMLVGSTSTPSTYVSTTALAANLVVTSTANKSLTGFQVSADATLAAADWWIMIYDATSAPADGAITAAKCYYMPATTTSYSTGFTGFPKFPNGIVIGVSTTGCFNKTASAHAFISGDVQ